MGEVSVTRTRLSSVEDPETGMVYESDGERLTVRSRCRCGTDIEGTAVLYDRWPEEFRENVIAAVTATVQEEECCG